MVTRSLKIKKSYTLLLLLVAWTAYCHAQTFSYKHYTVEDGLPSSQVYSAFQDSKGYMWFATDAGVSRFNGYEFENFDVNDGLTDNTVFLITEDTKGRIWFGTFNCKLSYYDKGKIYPYQYNHVIEENIFKNSHLISFNIDADNTVFFGTKYQGIVKVNSRGQLTTSNPDGQKLAIDMLLDSNFAAYGYTPEHNEYYLKNTINRYDTIYLNINYNNNSNLTKSTSLVSALNDLESKYACHIYEKVANQLFYYNTPDNTFLIDLTDVKRVRKLQGLSFINSKSTSAMFDGEYLWLSFLKQGAFQCKIEKDTIKIIHHYLNNKGISRVYKSNDGAYWFLTLQDGVYYLPTKDINLSKFETEKISQIEIDTSANDLYILLKGSHVYKANSAIKGRKKIYQSDGNATGIKWNDYTKELIIDDLPYGLKLWKEGEEQDIKIMTQHNKGFKSILTSKDTIYKVNHFGFSMIADKKESYFSYTELDNRMWCTSLSKREKGGIWIGTNNGVKLYQSGKIHEPFKKNKYLSSAVTSMCQLNNLVLIGTKNHGLLLMKEDSFLHKIDKTNGLVDNLIRTIYVDSDNTVWVGTNKGLSRLVYNNKTNYEIVNLTTKHGLVSEEITDIVASRKIVYLATNKGLISINKASIKKNYTVPPVYITAFKVNMILQKSYQRQFTYNQNFIKLNYEGLNYKSQGKVNYQYRMLGVDTNWQATLSREVQYPTLQPGDYTFEVKAANEDGIWSPPTQLSFTILPPFWLTWWFITAEIVLGLLIIILVFRYREKQIKQKASAQKRIVELELKALRSQMNPHFIFNTLNSIQHFIAVSDFRSTNRYLTQFAKLIRMVLNLSEKNVITIQEEIDMLTLYMDLEKMRFDEEFDYIIQIDKNIDTDYDQLPSMLIQPYVENAIWHGLMNKNEKGVIKIALTLDENYICCTVEDNGIGREKAAEIKAKRNINRKSVGMSITGERLDILNKEEANVEVHDLKDKEGRAKGTKVTIKIVSNYDNSSNY